MPEDIEKYRAPLLSEIKRLIEDSRSQVATVVNTVLVLLNWEIGNLIKTNVLINKRAEYGDRILLTLSENLTEEYGRGWSEKHLRHCLRSAETFTEEQILYAVQRQLSWTHLKSIFYIDDGLKREFYLHMAANERWSTRYLANQIDSMLFERMAISKKPEELIKAGLSELKIENKITPDLVFKDPYFLDFLGLKDTFSEKDLENAILRNIENFILELGQGFAFIERQKRIMIDGEDFKLDLLFYHRKLKRLIAIELKLGKFKAAYKAQMELYLRWLEKHEMQSGEDPPIGLLLCAEGNREQIELLQLENAGIKVSEYLTELPDKKLLKEKLHLAIEISKNRISTDR